HGSNHPVQDLETGAVEITAQNHCFAVTEDSLTRLGARVTHRSLNDGTVEGMSLPDRTAFSVQYHPEASPGPHDSIHLFRRFRALMDRQAAGVSS
ncbi:MAG: carbamoyl phosphate synthase small subunit, partial [Planctomycetes bacterium]|nr:carbamoyl phosphate synthase small subunit [Planctomycetota bacterium]